MLKKTISMLLALFLPAAHAVASDTEKLIALTFDDGPNTTTTNEVLDKLEEYGVVGTFFVIGDNITPESEKSMLRARELGCDIENHSKTHSDMTKQSSDVIKSEISFTSDRVESVTGVAPRYFRPPYIAVNEEMHDSIELPFICGVGCNDWVPSVSAEERADIILKSAKNGDIILLHDMPGNQNTVKALDTIIPELKLRGFTFVTVDELFRRAGTEFKKGFVYTNAYQTTPR